MTAELALVLGLLVSSSCEVRGRDPDLEDNAQKEGVRMRGPLLGATAAPPPAARGRFRSRSWCGPSTGGVLTATSQCRTEGCTIRSACPGRQLILSAVSHCPLHKQQQLIFWWCCCSGNGEQHPGAADALEWPLTGPSATSVGSQPNAALGRAQNDQQHGHAPPALQPGHYGQVSSRSGAGPEAAQLQRPAEEPQATEEPGPGAQPRSSPRRYDSFLAPLPVPHMMALLMSQLQPLMEGFNMSLQQLSRQVAVLSHEVAQLKRQGGVQAAQLERSEAQSDPASLLLGNLSSFQRDMDRQLQRQQEEMDAVNATLAQAHSQLREQVRALAGGVDSLDGQCRQLRRDALALNERINQTARSSQVQFMETGLEVEAAREVVLRRVTELAGNLSLREQRLQEAEADLDYLFSSLSRLEMGVANLTEQVSQNRLALDEGEDRSSWPGDRTDEWEPAVEALQRSLQQVASVCTAASAWRALISRRRFFQVKVSVVSEQAKSRRAEVGLARLGDSLAGLLLEAVEQKEQQQQQKEALTRLSGSFKSLLQDGIRHNDVLELLLGQEVLEFLEWPVPEQEAHSIPAVKEQLHLLQERLGRSGTGGSSGWPRGRRRAALLPGPEGARGAGADLRRLEQQVELLGEKLRLLEAQRSSCCGPREEDGQDGRLGHSAGPPGTLEAGEQSGGGLTDRSHDSLRLSARAADRHTP
ncbi:multimerin-2a [Synchiropus splendidus]|uniref:multimerin-2a n=1 Tax=Synchiropus splendidus TaxID=270530 RepID=UPI00237ED825|nr:multimerin-2a [Synchiropus splendidus]